MQFNLNVCSFCRQRPPGKLATGYWSWFNADGSRVCWKLVYCPECAREHLFGSSSVLQTAAQTQDLSACVSCHSEVQDAMDPVWLTLYLPGKERTDIGLPLDAACAARLRIPLTTHGQKLRDRQPGSNRGAPAVDAWAAIGIEPRVA